MYGNQRTVTQSPTPNNGHGKRLRLIKKYLPPLDDHASSFPENGDAPFVPGSIVVTSKAGMPRYGIVSAVHKDGTASISTVLESNITTYDVPAGTYWHRSMRVVPREIAERALELYLIEARPKKKAPVAPPPVRQPLAEALEKRAADVTITTGVPIATEVRHVAALPKSLVDDIAAMQAKLVALADQQAQLWADYVAHAETIEKKLSILSDGISECLTYVQAQGK